MRRATPLSRSCAQGDSAIAEPAALRGSWDRSVAEFLSGFLKPITEGGDGFASTFTIDAGEVFDFVANLALRCIDDIAGR